MDRRDFLKKAGIGFAGAAVSGGAISSESLGVRVPSALKKEDIVKTKVSIPAKQANSHSIGYARLVRVYDIQRDQMVSRLDIIDGRGVQKSINFLDGEMASAKKELLLSVSGRFSPAPKPPGINCKFIRL